MATAERGLARGVNAIAMHLSVSCMTTGGFGPPSKYLAAGVALAVLFFPSAISHAGKQSLICLNPSISKPPSPTLANLGNAETEKLEFQPKNEREDMSATAQLLLRDYAGHQWPTLNHKGRMARLAGHLRMGHRRVRALYQNEFGVRVRADEMAAIQSLQQREIEEANRNDFQALQARIARLEAALFQSDEEFHHEQMAALRTTAHGRR